VQKAALPAATCKKERRGWRDEPGTGPTPLLVLRAVIGTIGVAVWRLGMWIGRRADSITPTPRRREAQALPVQREEQAGGRIA